jgi:hypothetical protein
VTSGRKENFPKLSQAVRAVIVENRPAATICAATRALAHCGLLDDRCTPATGAS